MQRCEWARGDDLLADYHDIGPAATVAKVNHPLGSCAIGHDETDSRKEFAAMPLNGQRTSGYSHKLFVVA